MVIAFRDKGHHVTVLCSHPIYPKWLPIKSDDQISGVIIKRGGLKIRYSSKMLVRRAVLELWFAFYVFRNIFKYRKELDIIIPVFPPSLAFYLVLPLIKKKIEKVGMVHDLQEVYSDKKKGLLNKVVGFFINKIEGSTFRGCDRLIFLSEEMKSTAQKSYKLNKDKLLVQYPFATVQMKNITNDLEDILPSDKKHIVYSGALGVKQNPKGVFDFFEYASENIKNAQFHFFSQGQIFDELKEKNKSNSIKFHDLVPRKNIEELYARSDVQIVPQLPFTSKGSLPSKLPNLLASGCKILLITDHGSEIQLLFNKHKLEKVVTSWDNKILLKSLCGLLEKENFNNKKQKRVATEFFSIHSMIEKII
jgi:hypothetical protein